MAVIVALVLVACFASPYSSLPAAGGGIKVPPLSCRSRPPPPPASSVLLVLGLICLVICYLGLGLVVPVVLVLAFIVLLFVDPEPSFPLVPVKIDENEREK